MKSIALAQFTSSSTAAIATIAIGFIPDYVEVILDSEGTAPNVVYWTNKSYFTEKTAPGTAIRNTGSTGVLSQDTASVTAYAGGAVVTAEDVTARRYLKADGTLYAVGDTVGTGITIPAGDQVNSGKNIIKAFRADR